MECKKNLFRLDDSQIFLNGAYMSPILRASEEAGIEGLRRKRKPGHLTKNDFFDPVDEVRASFARLISISDPQRVVVIPSASYGLANVAQNIPDNSKKEIILLEDQFPSNYYVWTKLAANTGKKITVIKKPIERSVSWSELIIDAISSNTAVISMAPIHWGDGTVFDIAAISEAARKNQALLIIDGTQSIGAIPFDQSVIHADAIITSAYKWLLGPYAIGLAYYGEAFDQGTPIEDSWLNRPKSDDFQYLTDYQKSYRPKARRYEVGEAPDFIKMPMLQVSLQQLLDWSPEAIQSYCEEVVTPILDPLREVGYTLSDNDEMAFHLFGVRLPPHLNMPRIKERLKQHKVIVSYRNDAIRISPNVYNTVSDLETLKDVLIGEAV